MSAHKIKIIAFCLRSAALFIPVQASPLLDLAPEARGVWLSRDVITGGTAVMHRVCDELSRAKFNRVLVNVQYLGGTIYPSAVNESVGGVRQLSEFTGRDPLREAIDIGHEYGLEVVAWFEYGLMSHFSGQDTADSGPVISAHPDWEALDKNGNHWHTSEFGNFHWLDAAHPEVRQFLVDLFGEAASGYPDLDGIETDRIRYPSPEFSYSDISRQRYVSETGNPDPVTITSGHPQWSEWIAWREQQTTRLAGQIYRKIKAINPGLLVSAAVAPPYMLLKHEKLQAWDAWADSGYVDALEPMIYVNDGDLPNQLNEALSAVPPGFLMYQGIGYRNDTSLGYQIGQVRKTDSAGMTIWYYGDLTPATLEMLRSDYFYHPATLPHNDIIVDDSDPLNAVFSGSWIDNPQGYLGSSKDTESADAQAIWSLIPVNTATYDLFARWPESDKHSNAVSYILVNGVERDTFVVDQTKNGEFWVFLGHAALPYDSTACIMLQGMDQHVVNADAVRAVRSIAFKLLDINLPDSVHLEIRCNRFLDGISVGNVEHYSIAPGITIHGAEIYQGQKDIIVLNTSPFRPEQVYTLTVRGLVDIAGVTLPDVAVDFRYYAQGNDFIVDNGDPTFRTYGSWISASEFDEYYGNDYLITEPGDGGDRAQWWTFIENDGNYEVLLWLPRTGSDMASAARYNVLNYHGVDTVYMDHREGGGGWKRLGIFRYEAGSPCSVQLSDFESGGTVIADALRVRRVIETVVEDRPETSFPGICELYQNYPNPFNAVTTIRYTVGSGHNVSPHNPSPVAVQLNIYNVLGQKIKTLISEPQPAGEYIVRWEASKVPSGIYYYSLKAGDYRQTKRLLLLK